MSVNIYMGSNVVGLLGNIECVGCVALDTDTKEPSLITFPESISIPLSELTEVRLLTGLELTNTHFPLHNFRSWKQTINIGGNL